MPGDAGVGGLRRRVNRFLSREQAQDGIDSLFNHSIPRSCSSTRTELDCRTTGQNDRSGQSIRGA